MNTAKPEMEKLCREHLTRYFEKYSDAEVSTRAAKAVRLLAAGEEPLLGKPAGWAAGLVYFLANQHRQACGVPGILNSEVESFFGVTMGTVRKRAAQVERRLTF